MLDSYGMDRKKSDNSLLMHSLYTVADIGKGKEVLKIYVEEMYDPTSKGTNKRAYKLTNIENASTASVRVQGQSLSSLTNTVNAIKNIADLFEFVKKYDDEFKPKSSSEIVNADGTPKLMYHGTKTENGDFYIFDQSKAKKKGGLGFKALGSGNYFTAKELDGTERYGSRVIKAYLDIKNPYKFYGGGSFKTEVCNALGLSEDISYDELQDEMRARGYDGVVQYGKNDEISIAVTFDSEQIKSVDNIGTFDKTNPDIRYSTKQKLSTKENFGTQDSEYLKAVENCDPEAVQRIVDEAAKAAGQKNNADQAAGDVKFSYKGKTEDGRSIYKTNYVKGTPKSVKQQDLIGLVENIWSKKPITLDVIRNGKPQKIVARFNPELTERSDLSKLAFGNRKGTASDQRITLDLASDFYQIAEESKYTKSKEETGKKDNPAHDGVFNWDYFVTNLIYQDENDNNIECYMNIDVKEKSDGHFFYSFAIKKGTAPQTLDAVVTDESATVPIDSIPEVKKSVKQENPITLFNIRTARENKVFRQIFTLLDDMAYSGIEVKKLPSEKDIRTQAKGLLSKYNSKYNEKEFAQELAVIYDYMMQNINNNLYKTEDFYNNVTFLAKKVIDKCTVKNTTLYDDNAEIRKILRSTPIYVSPQLESEIISQFGSYKSFRNMLMGKVMRLSTVNEKAATLDEVWQELSELAPEYFPKDMNELDMPMQLTAFFESIAPKVVNPYEHFQENIEDAAAELATDIFQKYFEIGRLKTPQEKYRNLVFENMKKLEQSKKAMRQEFKQKAAQGITHKNRNSNGVLTPKSNKL